MNHFLLYETPWNLLLAVIPALLGYGLGYGMKALTLERRRVPGWAWTPLALAWFAFLPNTCYLLTEWRHFLFDRRLPVWAEISRVQPHIFDLAVWSLFFVVYTAGGVLLFTLGIRPVRNLLRQMRVRVWAAAVPFYLLMSLGVYLGLVLRLNSWDLWTRNRYVLQLSWQAVQEPRVATAVVFFAVVLWLLFEISDMWVEGFKLKLRQWHWLPANDTVRPDRFAAVQTGDNEDSARP